MTPDFRKTNTQMSAFRIEIPTQNSGSGFKFQISGFGIEYEKFGIRDQDSELSLKNSGFRIEFEKFGIRD